MQKSFLFLSLLSTSIFSQTIKSPNIYGNATVYLNANNNSKESKIGLENEMYIGFKGASTLENDLDLNYQFESGYIGEDGAKIGNRNTFVSLIFKNRHEIKAGRMTTGLYDIIDWPFAHTLGNLADWTLASDNMAMYDRNGNTIRYNLKDNKYNFSLSYGPQDSSRNNFFDSSLIASTEHFTLYTGIQFKNDLNESTKIKQQTKILLFGIEKRIDKHLIYSALKKIQLKNSNTAYTDDQTQGIAEVNLNDDIEQTDYIAAYSYSINKHSSKIAYLFRNKIKLNGKKMNHSSASEIALQHTYSLGEKTALFSRFIQFYNNKLTKYGANENGKNAFRIYVGISHDF